MTDASNSLSSRYGRAITRKPPSGFIPVRFDRPPTLTRAGLHRQKRSQIAVRAPVRAPAGLVTALLQLPLGRSTRPYKLHRSLRRSRLCKNGVAGSLRPFRWSCCRHHATAVTPPRRRRLLLATASASQMRYPRTRACGAGRDSPRPRIDRPDRQLSRLLSICK